MLRNNEHHSATKEREEVESRFSSDLANLQNSFGQLRKTLPSCSAAPPTRPRAAPEPSRITRPAP